MRVGWDIDGVGFTFGDSCHKHLLHTGRGHLWKSGPTPDPYWDWYKDWGWTGAQFVEFCNEAADCGCLFSGPVRPGYAEAVKEVKALGHTNVFITDRAFGSTPQVSQDITYAWFEQHGIEFDELHFSPDKTIVWTDTYIDDKLTNYDALNEVGTEVYLLNRPWNTPHSDDRRRINTIEEYVDHVRDRSLARFMV
jgi:hypothetical protein